MERNTRSNFENTGVLGDIDKRVFSENISKASEFLEGLDNTEFFEHIANPSEIHRILFNKTIEGNQSIGEFRTDALSIVYFTEGMVLTRTQLRPVDEIQPLLNLTTEYLEKIVLDGLSVEESMAYICGAIVTFFAAHPFTDGNGRTLRLIIKMFCKRFGFSISENWTILERPYNLHFNYAIRHYQASPYLLLGAIREFIEPITQSEGSYRMGSRTNIDTNCLSECRDIGDSNVAAGVACMYTCGWGEEDHGKPFYEYEDWGSNTFVDWLNEKIAQIEEESDD